MNITTSLSVSNMVDASISRNLPIPFSNLDVLSKFLCDLFQPKTFINVGIKEDFLNFVEDDLDSHMEFPQDPGVGAKIDPEQFSKRSESWEGDDSVFNTPLKFVFFEFPPTGEPDVYGGLRHVGRGPGFTLDELVETFFVEPTHWNFASRNLGLTLDFNEFLPSYKERFKCVLVVDEVPEVGNRPPLEGEEDEVEETDDDDIDAKPKFQEKSVGGHVSEEKMQEKGGSGHVSEEGLEDFAKHITTKILPYVEVGKVLSKSDAQEGSSIGDQLQKVGCLLSTMGHLCAFQHAKYKADKISCEDDGLFCKNFGEMVKRTLRTPSRKRAEPKTTASQRANDKSGSVSAYGILANNTLAVQEQYHSLLENLMDPVGSLNQETFTPSERGPIEETYIGQWEVDRFDRLMTDLDGLPETLRLRKRNPALYKSLTAILSPALPLSSASPDFSVTPYSQGPALSPQQQSGYGPTAYSQQVSYPQGQPGYLQPGNPALYAHPGYPQGHPTFAAGAPPSLPLLQQPWASMPQYAPAMFATAAPPTDLQPQFGVGSPGEPFSTINSNNPLSAARDHSIGIYTESPNFAGSPKTSPDSNFDSSKGNPKIV